MSLCEKEDRSKLTLLHCDFRLWLRVFNHVKSVYLRNDTFQRTYTNGQPYKLKTLKYMWRILCKFPIENKSSSRQITLESEALDRIERAFTLLIRRYSRAFENNTDKKPTVMRVNHDLLSELSSHGCGTTTKSVL